VKLGITLRVMGPQATVETIQACARAAEAAGLDDVWVSDHIAIPPDDAEGSGGRYLDPLATLAFLASATRNIGLGTAVLILPYRPPLPTAKWIATVQELSGGRLQLGVGIGWMAPEFRALGIPRSRRGALSDEMLELLHDCFSEAGDDVVERNGQRFLFRPHPPRPPILIGGAPPHALERTLRWGDGWMPMLRDPEQLAEPAAELRERAAAAGRPTPEVVVLTGLPVADRERALERLGALERAGATHVIHGASYADADEYRETADRLGELRRALGPAS
jgi:probable F420-dependent oxidoreductase